MFYSKKLEKVIKLYQNYNRANKNDTKKIFGSCLIKCRNFIQKI